MHILLLYFMIYPDLNLVMYSIRILNNKKISLSVRLIYFMTYTAYFPRINIFVTRGWPRAGAETCRQFKITSKKLSCVLSNLNPSACYFTKHNGDDACKDFVQFWAPDDRRKNRPKYVQRLTEINKLRIVATRWLYSDNILAMYWPMNVKFNR